MAWPLKHEDGVGEEDPREAEGGVGSPHPDPVGKVLSGKYLVIGLLGSGAMGTVYDCENFAIGRRVAIKVLDPLHAGRREAVSRFQREARAAAQIGHPNIVEVLDMGQTDEGLPYIVMERLEGDDLCTVLASMQRLRPAQAIDVAIQVLGALGAAHAAGIVHRDLKPENVFLARRGLRTDFVKILDFGVAKFRDAVEEGSSRLTRDGTTVGTPAYMSPEQASGSSDIDARSDLYSAGVLLYEMLSGLLPHEGDTCNAQIVAIVTQEPRPLEEVAPWIPAALARVVRRAMSRARTERFQSAQEFRAALEPFVEAESLDIPPEALPPRARPAAMVPTLDMVVPRFRRRRAAVVALGVVLVASAISAVMLRPSGARSPRLRSRPMAAAPAAAASPETASLDVESSPVGASVELDGAQIGRTPLHVVVPRTDGPHLVRLEAPGHEPARRSISLRAPVRLVIDLEPLPVAPAEPVGTKRARPRTRPPSGLMFDESVYRR